MHFRIAKVRREVDWKNPITQNLVAAITVDTSRLLVNLVSYAGANGIGGAFNGEGSRLLHPYINQGSFPQLSMAPGNQIGPQFNGNGGNKAWFAFAEPYRTLASSRTVFVALSLHAITTWHYISGFESYFGAFLGGNLTVSPSGQPIYTDYDSGTKAVVGAGGLMVTNKLQTIAGVTKSGTDIRVYAEGAHAGTTAFGTAATPTDQGMWLGNSDLTFGAVMHGIVPLVLGFHRDLSAEEIAWLHRDITLGRYSFLENRTPMLYSFAAPESIPLDPGSFAIDGVDLDVVLDPLERIDLDPADISWDGVDLGINERTQMVLDPGTFPWTGVDLGINNVENIILDPGDLSTDGSDLPSNAGDYVILDLLQMPIVGVALDVDARTNTILELGIIDFEWIGQELVVISNEAVILNHMSLEWIGQGIVIVEDNGEDPPVVTPPINPEDGDPDGDTPQEDASGRHRNRLNVLIRVNRL